MSSYGTGYTRVIEVDLLNFKIKKERLEEHLVSSFVGGRGFTTKMQYNFIPPHADPLGEENVLIFATGPLVGTGAPAGNRFTIGAKSPLTRILGDSACGGLFATRLRRAGYDVVIIRGKSEKPAYLYISPERVELRSAETLWGKDVYETTEELKRELGGDAGVATIGPGGKNLVRFASVVTDDIRVAGRTGMGAVMGSKNLKAIAVQPGNRRVNVLAPESMRRARNYVLELLHTDPLCTEIFPRVGTTIWLSESGIATKNFQQSYFSRTANISGERLIKEYVVGTETCFACPIRCGHLSAVNRGPFQTDHPVRVEFFSLASFGTNLYNSNLESIIRAVELCNRFGLDVAETGARVAFLMECQQRGLIEKKALDGYDFSWGNSRTLVEMIPKLAHREGIGDIMAEGILDLARHVGQGAESFAIHVKGMSPEYMDPRANKVYGSRLRVASRGGDHLRAQGAGGAHALDEMPFKQGVRELLRNEILCAVHDMMGVCKFPYGIISSTRERSRLKTEVGLPWLCSAATGSDLSWEELSLAAERVINLERLFNVREGLTRKDDELPRRLMEEPIPAGKYKGQVYDIGDKFISEYYSQRQWDDNGVPSAMKLDELGLNA